MCGVCIQSRSVWILCWGFFYTHSKTLNIIFQNHILYYFTAQHVASSGRSFPWVVLSCSSQGSAPPPYQPTHWTSWLSPVARWHPPPTLLKNCMWKTSYATLYTMYVWPPRHEPALIVLSLDFLYSIWSNCFRGELWIHILSYTFKVNTSSNNNTFRNIVLFSHYWSLNGVTCY